MTHPRLEPTRSWRPERANCAFTARGRSRSPPESDDGAAIVSRSTSDMVWIPPGWWHEVFTVEGEHVTHDIEGVSQEMCVSWVTWACPAPVRDLAFAQWAAGWVVEKQCQADVDNRVSKALRQKCLESYLQEMYHGMQ